MASNHDISITSMSSSGDELILAVIESPQPTSPQPGPSHLDVSADSSLLLRTSPQHPATSSPIKSELLRSSPLDISNVSSISWLSGGEGDISGEGDVSDISLTDSIEKSPTFMRRFHQQRLNDLHEHHKELEDIMTQLRTEIYRVEYEISSEEEKLRETKKLSEEDEDRALREEKEEETSMEEEIEG